MASRAVPKPMGRGATYVEVADERATLWVAFLPFSASLGGPSSSPVPLAWVGPPRLKLRLGSAWALGRFWSRELGTGDGRCGPEGVTTWSVPLRARFSPVGQPAWASSVSALRPPLRSCCGTWSFCRTFTPPGPMGRDGPAGLPPRVGHRSSAARLCPPGGRRRTHGALLDAGCGTGEHTVLAARRGADALGIDVSPRAIEIARRKAAERGVGTIFQVLDALHLDTLGESCRHDRRQRAVPRL